MKHVETRSGCWPSSAVRPGASETAERSTPRPCRGAHAAPTCRVLSAPRCDRWAAPHAGSGRCDMGFVTRGGGRVLHRIRTNASSLQQQVERIIGVPWGRRRRRCLVATRSRHSTGTGCRVAVTRAFGRREVTVRVGHHFVGGDRRPPSMGDPSTRAPALNTVRTTPWRCLRRLPGAPPRSRSRRADAESHGGLIRAILSARRASG